LTNNLEGKVETALAWDQEHSRLEKGETAAARTSAGRIRRSCEKEARAIAKAPG